MKIWSYLAVGLAAVEAFVIEPNAGVQLINSPARTHGRGRRSSSGMHFYIVHYLLTISHSL